MESNNDKLIVKGQFLLKKMQMKGGWTYAELPNITKRSSKAFGFLRVKGTIDGVEIKAYHLMPMGNGNLFLPVKAKIRKMIKKEEGDMIHVELFEDNSILEVPQELIQCLEYDPSLLKKFESKSESEKTTIVKWIYEVKMEKTRESRIIELIEMLEKEN